MQQAATDPNTGQINMDIITTGVTKTSSDRLNAIKEFIINLQVSFFLFEIFNPNCCFRENTRTKCRALVSSTVIYSISFSKRAQVEMFRDWIRSKNSMKKSLERLSEFWRMIISLLWMGINHIQLLGLCKDHLSDGLIKDVFSRFNIANSRLNLRFPY